MFKYSLFRTNLSMSSVLHIDPLNPHSPYILDHIVYQHSPLVIHILNAVQLSGKKLLNVTSLCLDSSIQGSCFIQAFCPLSYFMMGHHACSMWQVLQGVLGIKSIIPWANHGKLPWCDRKIMLEMNWVFVLLCKHTCLLIGRYECLEDSVILEWCIVDMRGWV